MGYDNVRAVTWKAPSSMSCAKNRWISQKDSKHKQRTGMDNSVSIRDVISTCFEKIMGGLRDLAASRREMERGKHFPGLRETTPLTEKLAVGLVYTTMKLG